MTDLNNINWSANTDSALMGIIGSFIKHHRLEQNKTQDQLAAEAGINRSTLSLFEKGKNGNLLTLIQLLRALHQLHLMQHFQINQAISPLQLAKQQQSKRKRASKAKKGVKKIKPTW